MKKYIKLFFSLWACLLIANQIFIFNGCFTFYCISAALPHTGIIAFFLTLCLKKGNKDTEKIRKEQKDTEKIRKEQKDTEKIRKEQKDTEKIRKDKPATRKFTNIENDDPLKKKGDRYEKIIGVKFEEKGNIVIYNGFIQGYKDEGVDIIAISPNDASINFIQCKNWTRKSMELSDIKDIYEKLNKFNFGCCIGKIEDSTIYEHLQIPGIGKDFLINKLGEIRKSHGAYTIRKTLYISSEKVVNIEVGRYLRMMKSNIFRYNDMKIVLVEELNNQG